MAQRELQIGDKIEFMGKKYRAESEEKTNSCVGCAFYGPSPCPVDGNCITGSLIFKEVKDVPRHIELGVVKVEGDRVTFKIVEQTHRGKKFSQQTFTDTFKASNGIKLGIRNFPEWSSDSSQLFCRGYSSDKDNIEIVCTTSEFAKISEAVTEYNNTDGKGYEKPWPQNGDGYFYVDSCGVAKYATFENGVEFDARHKACGNFFRTKEDAMAAAEKVKALFKELAAK